MRLAILIYSMSGGGAERVVSNLLSSLHDQNIKVHLVLMNDTIRYHIPKEIPIHYLEKSNAMENGLIKMVKIPFLAYKYARLIKTLDVTHSLSLLARPNYINTLSRKFSGYKYKVAISERNYPSMQYGSEDLKSKINRWLIKKLYPKADLIICNSKASRMDLIENFTCKGNKIEVIYNPIDKETIDEISPLNDFFDSHYFNVVAVGRLETAKNHELLINAVKDLKDVRLYILGHGPLKQKLDKKILKENLVDRVFLLGFDNNPYKYLKGADLFMLGSNNEGFPNVMLEAMACGLPILSTNCKSGPSEMMLLTKEETDLMITDYGLLVPVKNEKLMAKGLQYMQANPEYLRNCRVNCLSRVHDFKKDLILNEFIDAMEKI